MKFDDLCSIGHNIADSFGSGASLLFDYGFYPYDDAKRSDDGLLEVDFLTGTVILGLPCDELRERLKLSPQIVADLCVRHGQSADVFASLRTRYIVTPASRRYEVIVSDKNGRTRTDHYDGIKGGRLSAEKHPPVTNT